MNIKKVIELHRKAIKACGWEGGSSIDLNYDCSEEGDLWLYIDIQQNKIIGDIRLGFNELYDTLTKIFGTEYKNIEFYEAEKDNINYIVGIKLCQELEGEKS